MADYYDIDDFLSGSETVSVNFNQPCRNLAFIDKSCAKSQRDIPENHRAELPLHLANPLATLDALKIKMPSGFGQGYKKKLRAAPVVVNLKKRNRNYYSKALQLREQ